MVDKAMVERETSLSTPHHLRNLVDVTVVTSGGEMLLRNIEKDLEIDKLIARGKFIRERRTRCSSPVIIIT
jgi:hypothetical protein